MEPSFEPVHISFPLPKHPHLNFHAHLTCYGNCTMVHLTTTDIGEPEGSVPPLGSFVYAMPDMRNDRSVISTALSTSGSSIDYATRMAKILARKMRQPVYVGCSMNFAGTTPEEEMEGLTVAVEQIMQRWNQKEP
ncbi:hypothetical protein HRR83_008137 [Exophiala dermatitidis]|uniref:Proteasome assembly chaperone 4 n=2 Tax=Exophiala dermatitidis TaxID=5970 RepID=H6BT35_EXODN|nr:uncharacterized protein HMPREF1120_02455 [Exophiala dermatitidis NIH/UT8656]KAJ4508023.1 hypothetical protein HRR74_007908 [Exophiala dermatitidis]EHY54285.1 hypothetical protein HMPREF1120_02455 [Exophiala dermatitidis NIH/UT8656]KAJ4513567.1 hypothetical protein HRR73_005725 [Exophiala dermatitidis]KAJ4544514.1 hypothetical protein HRR76_002572 [Exophiala dermatitidis]KAJ4564959.1 hypothetical protein HRR81_007924 [Exophiala dermatitidis]